MLLYCLKCRKNTESPKIYNDKKRKNNAFIKNEQCVIVKKSKFSKEQEASGLLSSLQIETPSSKIPLVRPILL